MLHDPKVNSTWWRDRQESQSCKISPSKSVSEHWEHISAFPSTLPYGCMMAATSSCITYVHKLYQQQEIASTHFFSLLPFLSPLSTIFLLFFFLIFLVHFRKEPSSRLFSYDFWCIWRYICVCVWLVGICVLKLCINIFLKFLVVIWQRTHPHVGTRMWQSSYI